MGRGGAVSFTIYLVLTHPIGSRVCGNPEQFGVGRSNERQAIAAKGRTQPRVLTLGLARKKARPESISNPLSGYNSGRARVLARRERLSRSRDILPSHDCNSRLGLRSRRIARTRSLPTFQEVVPREWRQKIIATGTVLLARPNHASLVPLTRNIVLVLVVVLVLERVCWWLLTLELYLCAFSELHPANAGLRVLSGHVF